jgi:signal transduction histidine kinase
LDNLEVGISVVDADLRLVAWNKRFIQLFGFPSGFVYRGQPIVDVMEYSARQAGLTGSELANYVEKIVEPVRERVPQVLERTRPSGTVLKIHGVPIPGGRYITSFTDVSELHGAALALKRANEQLEKTNERLEEGVKERTKELIERTEELIAANAALVEAKAQAERATRAQTRFLAAASHDVLQPLQAARLLLGTLAEDILTEDDAVLELLSNADLSIESADRLLRALLNLARLEVGGLKPEVQAVDVGALLEELRREFALVAAEKGLILRAIPTKTWVLSDIDLLRSIFQNLISNAVRYTRTGAILIGCRFDQEGVRLEVWDSGPGIPKDQMGTIFKEFSRLPNGIDAGPGAGLGLSIVVRICSLLAHKLSVRSRVGEGSVFSVTMPRAENRQSAGAQAIAGVLPKGLRVLYVENDPGVLQSMVNLLTRWGLNVSAANSLAQALELKGDWDVVMADYHLDGEENGLDVLKAVQGRARLFALITAAPTDEILDRSAALDIDVIRKPVSPAVLRTFLGSVSLRDVEETV